ncbi:MAG: Cas10/Cmr2 second palm domain-containing protein, partial [bacterium]
MRTLPSQDWVFADGGKFQLIFETDNINEVTNFGADLAEFYRRVTDSSLTYIDNPPEIRPGANESEKQENYRKAVQEAEKRLREAKACKISPRVEPQAPYWAICEDCGIRYAVKYVARRTGPRVPRNLCQTCINKTQERDGHQSGYLQEFSGKLGENYKWGKMLPWQDDCLPREDRKDAIEIVEAFDPRRYVGYLLADGNGMGALFEKCKLRDATQLLSEKLSKIILDSLAEPMPHLSERLNEVMKTRAVIKDYLPVYPLYLGGDDIFVLLPAAYAINYAVRFCQQFEEKMYRLLREDALFDNIAREEAYPTMSAAVVICKGNYPYTLAHQRGESLLRKAKQLSKSTSGKSLSSVNFEVVLGSEMVSQITETISRPPFHQRPYWVMSRTALDAVTRGLALDINVLFDQRYSLRFLPQKRVIELRSLFDPTDRPAGS